MERGQAFFRLESFYGATNRAGTPRDRRYLGDLLGYYVQYHYKIIKYPSDGSNISVKKLIFLK